MKTIFFFFIAIFSFTMNTMAQDSTKSKLITGRVVFNNTKKLVPKPPNNIYEALVTQHDQRPTFKMEILEDVKANYETIKKGTNIFPKAYKIENVYTPQTGSYAKMINEEKLKSDTIIYHGKPVNGPFGTSVVIEPITKKLTSVSVLLVGVIVWLTDAKTYPDLANPTYKNAWVIEGNYGGGRVRITFYQK